MLQSVQAQPSASGTADLHTEKGLCVMNKASEISVILLEWYDRCARKMPWRGIHDPYRTWVSEIMLQQTRVETVIPYYERFLSRFPSLQDLASADEADVLKYWEGLGYYSRARNLLKGARQVMQQYQGILPKDPALLRKISGIGPYTAGAIASIAYNVPVPAVDGNVLRVYSRFFGIRESIQLPAVRKELDRIASAVVSADRPGDYNQAVMDLGAVVCVPGTPDCTRCPLSSFCDAFSRGDAPDLPVIPGKAPQKVIHWTVPVIVSGNRTLVRRRTESLLHGLWCFPLLDCEPENAPALLKRKFHFPVSLSGASVHVRHVFTHLIWEMEILPLEAPPDLPAPPDFSWVCRENLNALVFPAAMNAALEIAVNIFSEKEKSSPSEED